MRLKESIPGVFCRENLPSSLSLNFDKLLIANAPPLLCLMLYSLVGCINCFMCAKSCVSRELVGPGQRDQAFYFLDVTHKRKEREQRE